MVKNFLRTSLIISGLVLSSIGSKEASAQDWGELVDKSGKRAQYQQMKPAQRKEVMSEAWHQTENMGYDMPSHHPAHEPTVAQKRTEQEAKYGMKQCKTHIPTNYVECDSYACSKIMRTYIEGETSENLPPRLQTLLKSQAHVRALVDAVGTAIRKVDFKTNG